MIHHPSNGFNMFFFLALNIDENVVKVHNNEDIELFCQDLINIALKHGWYIGQSERYYLVLQLAVVGLENRFPFITFSNSHLMIGIS